jgi:hypothetical protein
MHKTLAQILPKPMPYRLIRGVDAARRAGDLAADVAAVFALNSMIEHAKATILITTIRAEPRAAMEVFTSLRSAQVVALKAAVQSKFPDRTNLFERALKVGKKFEDHRNKFAHWEWAVVSELPNYLGFIDPKSAGRWVVEQAEIFGENLIAEKAFAKARLASEAHRDVQRHEMHLYDQASLKAVEQAGRLALARLWDFHAAVSLGHHEPEWSEKEFLALEAQLPLEKPLSSKRGRRGRSAQRRRPRS